ncbi:MAG TPA: glycosyltransferase N-terminal domain-containing protein, partial [Lacibacter sp.]|nr:glycosyltransferase N-terminal domain-containing protein [Lacibacter sp.]
EALRKAYPTLRILVTFFSPSGYEVRRRHPAADFVLYLPFDGPANAAAFLNRVQPRLALFVKYEFWHFYLEALQQRGIPAVLVSGIFRPGQPFFQPWGGFHRQMLQRFAHLFVQEGVSRVLLEGIGLGERTSVAGDTRFDRVVALARQQEPIPAVEGFIDGRRVLVAGSTWPQDEALLISWYEKNRSQWQLILAPHEIHASHLQQLQAGLPGCVRYADLEEHPAAADVLLVDRIGLLSRLYRYAAVCYVGGGFNKSGHHNILEAAVYGKAVITGPVFEKFRESVELKQCGGSFLVHNAEELAQVLAGSDLAKGGTRAGAYVQEHTGATARVLAWIQEKRLFTSA